MSAPDNNSYPMFTALLAVDLEAETEFDALAEAAREALDAGFKVHRVLHRHSTGYGPRVLNCETAGVTISVPDRFEGDRR